MFNPGIRGILEEGEKVMARNATGESMDAAIIAGAQKAGHYEISGYGTAACYAEMLGHDGIARRCERHSRKNRRPTPRLIYWPKA